MSNHNSIENLKNKSTSLSSILSFQAQQSTMAGFNSWIIFTTVTLFLAMAFITIEAAPTEKEPMQTSPLLDIENRNEEKGETNATGEKSVTEIDWDGDDIFGRQVVLVGGVVPVVPLGVGIVRGGGWRWGHRGWGGQRGWGNRGWGHRGK